MAKEKTKGTSRVMRPALTPEARENQLIYLATDLAEKQLREGTASSQVITHYLKLGSTKEKLQREKLEEENKPSKAYDTDYYVETRYEAEKIVSDIHSLIRTVGHASVSDLLTILGIRSNYCDTQYGWINCVDINPIEENGKHIIRCLAPSKLNELNKEKEN